MKLISWRRLGEPKVCVLNWTNPLLLHCICLRQKLQVIERAINTISDMYIHMSPSGYRGLRRHPLMLHGLHPPPEPRTSPKLLL